MITKVQKKISTERYERGDDYDSNTRVWNEWIQHPWRGIFTVQQNEEAITEHYMTDADIAASLTQFHKVDSDSKSHSSFSSSLLSIEHAEFEFSDGEESTGIVH